MTERGSLIVVFARENTDDTSTPPSPTRSLSFLLLPLPEGVKVLLVERKGRGPCQSSRRRDRGAEVRQVLVRHRRTQRRGRLRGDPSRSAQLVHPQRTRVISASKRVYSSTTSVLYAPGTKFAAVWCQVQCWSYPMTRVCKGMMPVIGRGRSKFVPCWGYILYILDSPFPTV